MDLLTDLDLSHRKKRWWLAFGVFLILFFMGAMQDFDGFYLGKITPAGETLARYEMFLFCVVLQLFYFIPFWIFVRYSDKKLHFGRQFAVVAFFTGWFIPGWFAGELNDLAEKGLKLIAPHWFVHLWSAAIIAPVVEETLKVLTVVFFLLLIGKRMKKHYLITGMCVGMGFQISEDLGYIEEQVAGTHHAFVTAIPAILNDRVVTGMVSHWCYTALMAVAVWLIFRQQQKKRGVALLLVPVLSHFLWDSPVGQMGVLFPGIISAVTFAVFLKVWWDTVHDPEDVMENLKTA